MSAANLQLRAAILIISDTAHADPSTDKAIPILEETFNNHDSRKWTVELARIVPDDISKIKEAIFDWCDGSSYMNLVITSGGTGFAVKDTTPEAIGPLIHRHAPGLVHGMLAASLQITPFAIMSRPVAGVRNKTLIITLPGSPKGAKENLESILKLLPHACLQAAGGDSRSLHSRGVKQLEQEAGFGTVATGVSAKPHHHGVHDHSHNHSHSHGQGVHTIPKAHTAPEDRPVSNDPRAGPTQRYRESPYSMLSVRDAVATVLEHTPLSEVIKAAVDTSLVGYILAEDVKARDAVPAFRASIVDGYAVKVTKEAPSTKGIFPVVSVSHARPGEIPPLQAGQLARITTGAPLPLDATSVIMVEDTVLKSTSPDKHEEKEVEILTDAIIPGENVREIGSDIPAGEVVLKKGEKISAVGGELGLLASVGRATVLVYKKPIIGVLSTGDEIIPHDRPGELHLGEVRDCNRLTVLACVKGWGYEVRDLGIAQDTSESLESTIRLAFRSVTTIITTGGVSMGELDLLKPTIERSLGGTVHFGRVAMKPGKPTTFSTIPFKNTTGDPSTGLIFSLPGNPASAVVTANLFVLPSLRKSAGEEGGEGLKEVTVVLDQDVRCDEKREEYHRVMIEVDALGVLKATSMGGQRSSRVGSLRGATGLLRLPAGGGRLEKGERVKALLMGGLGA